MVTPPGYTFFSVRMAFMSLSSVFCSTARVYMGLTQLIATSSTLPMRRQSIIHFLARILRSTNRSISPSPL